MRAAAGPFAGARARGYDGSVFDPADKPLEEREYPDEAEIAELEADETLSLRPCDRCGELIYEDADWCPHCRGWTGAGGGRARWHFRAGRHLARVLLVNWLFWLAVAALAAAAAVVEVLR